MKNTVNRNVWLELIRVSGPVEHPQLDGAIGAYVTVVTAARTMDECMLRVEDGVQRIGLALEEVLWCERLRDRLSHYDVDEAILRLARSTERDSQTRFGVFYTWEKDC